MATERDLRIIGVVSNGLSAGAEWTGAPYDTIAVVGDGSQEGKLLSGGVLSGGLLTLSGGVLHTKGTGNFTVNGAIDLNATGGSVTGFVFGGGKVSANSGESVTFTQDLNFTVTGGSFASGVYALGYATGTAGETVLSATGAVNVTIDDGTFASNLYLGAFADTATAAGGAINATISGGTIRGALVGGGFSQQGGASNVGAVSITVTGGEIASIIGGGSHVNNSDNETGSTTVASVAIEVSGGSIGSIYAGGHYNNTKAGYYGTDTVTGNAELTLSGDATVDKAAGSWNGIDTVTGQRKLVFDDYTGTCGTVCDWDLVTFDGENATTVDLSSATVYGVGEWNFDVIGREAAATTALVDLGDGFEAASTVDLRITNASTSLTSWSLAGVNGSQESLRFNVYSETSAAIATNLTLGATIAEGTFAGYGFSIDNGTLKFAQISA